MALLCLIAQMGACDKPAPQTPKPSGPATPNAPEVKAEGGAFVLRYFSPTTGSLLVAQKPADVPEGARSQVLVVPNDPKLHGPWLFVSDLTKVEQGSHPTRVVDRYELEKKYEMTQAAKAATAPQAASGEVILYKTAWCGYCTKAADYLEAKGVAFQAKDLERDPGARQDMIRRAQAAGFDQSRLQGVPILYIKGRILTGFSRDAIDQALGG